MTVTNTSDDRAQQVARRAREQRAQIVAFIEQMKANAQASVEKGQREIAAAEAAMRKLAQHPIP